MALSPYLYLSSFSIITSFFSPPEGSILLWGKLYFSYFQANSYLHFYLCPSNIQPLFFFSILHLFYFSSRFFISFCIVIKSPLSLLSSSVVCLISFDLSSYVRSFKSDTILVAILCIPYNFVSCFFFLGNHIITA